MRQPAACFECFQHGCTTLGSLHVAQFTLLRDISISLAKGENSEHIRHFQQQALEVSWGGRWEVYGAYGENPSFHYVAERSLSLRSKGVFYYSVPTLDFLHKHLWGPRNFQFVTMAVRGLCQPWISPERHHERPGRLS